VGTSDTVYVVTKASANAKDVNLSLPGTNIERFRVPIEDLIFVDLAPRAPAKPAKPSINVDEVCERLSTVQQSSMEQFSGDIAILKKYLRYKGVSIEALAELDSLCKATEYAWEAAILAISKLLEET
jgi:hypothetical protein